MNKWGCKENIDVPFGINHSEQCPWYRKMYLGEVVDKNSIDWRAVEKLLKDFSEDRDFRYNTPLVGITYGSMAFGGSVRPFLRLYAEKDGQTSLIGSLVYQDGKFKLRANVNVTIGVLKPFLKHVPLDS